MIPENVDLRCQGCGLAPSQLEEYVGIAEEEGMTPERYVWQREGTLNRKNGHFLCTECYIRAGQPSSSHGWACP